MSAALLATAHNRLLNALPQADHRRLLALCEPIDLVPQQILFEAKDALAHVLFPVQGWASLQLPLPGQISVVLGLVGCEGMLGLPLVLGVAVSPYQATVQGPGRAWRLGRVDLARALVHSPGLRRVLNHYLYVVLVQGATATGCRRLHALGPRLARWLLMSQDRAEGEHFHATHEGLAWLLGVRRVGITVAAGQLQRAGLIHYHRGEVTVIDRPGLEAQACDCYAADSRVYASLIPG